MSSNLITIAIPTRNRPQFLSESLQSVLAQTYGEMDIIVLDNASDVEHNIEKVINDLGDSRVKYVKNQEDLGIIGNWNRAIELCDTKYLSIFHDDDIMLPDFVDKSIEALEHNPNVGMSYSHANKVDPQLNYLGLWSNLAPNIGVIKGQEYLKYTVDNGCCITIAPTVVVRRDVYDHVGMYQEELCFNSFDFNMWIRIAQAFDIYFIDEVLVNYRLHQKQMSQTYWWSDDKAKGRLATMLEVFKALAYLLNSDPNADMVWLSQKMDEYTKLTAEYAKKLVPGL